MKKDNMNSTFDSVSLEGQEEQIIEQVENFQQIREVFLELRKKQVEEQIKSNQDIIQRTLQQAKRNNYRHLAVSLPKLYQENKSDFSATYNQAIKQIKQMIKDKVSETLSDMPKEQAQFYMSVLKQYQYIIERTDRKLSIATTTEQLFKLDVLSLILHTFKSKFNTFKLTQSEQIKQILQINDYFYRTFSVYYRRVSKILQFKFIGNNISQLIITLALLRAKMRIFVQRHRQSFVAADQMKTFANKIIKQQEQHEDIYRHYKYNYCELALLIIYKENEEFSNFSVHQAIQNYENICSQPNHQLQKSKLLVMKARYKVNFGFLFRCLWYIKQNQKQRITPVVKDSLDIQRLEKVLPYLFLKYRSFEEAFQKSQINTIFGLKRLPRNISLQKSRAASLIAVVAYKRFKQLASILQAQLFFQKLFRSFLVIKKFQFSYQMIKGIKHNPKTDIIVSLILATNTKKLQFFYIQRAIISDKIYLNILWTLIQKAKAKKRGERLCVILFEVEFSKSLLWHQFIPFANKLKKYFNSKTYLTNISQYCELNIMLYVYIKHLIVQQEPTINEENFYQIIQKCIKRVLIGFANLKISE